MNLEIDLVIEIIYFFYSIKEFNGTSLLGIKFNKKNANLYGTKLLSAIFTLQELSNGFPEPEKSTRPPLDPIRMNLIKRLFYFHILSDDKKPKIYFMQDLVFILFMYMEFK